MGKGSGNDSQRPAMGFSNSASSSPDAVTVNQPEYQELHSLLELIDEPNGSRMRKLLADHRETYAHAKGSSHNHQAWPGGFWDHTRELLNLAKVQYESLAACRPLPFSLSDALLILAAHDLEKMVRFDKDGTPDPRLDKKADKAAFRWNILEKYGIQLSPEQANALRYAEGVRDSDYTNTRRTMGPLAVFVHTCDLLSARMWYNYPADDDPWQGASRSHPQAQGIDISPESFNADGTVQ